MIELGAYGSHDGVTSTTTTLMATPGLTAGRDLLLFVYITNATTTITSVQNQSGAALATVTVADIATTAVRCLCLSLRIPSPVPTSIRFNISSARLIQSAFVELDDTDATDLIDETAGATRANNVSATTMVIGPTGAVTVPGSYAVAFVGMHNNVGSFSPWAGGFTSLGVDKTRISLAARTANTGTLTATASWLNSLQGAGLVVTARAGVVEPLVVSTGADIGGALVGVPITRTALVTNAEPGDTFTWTWTLTSKPAASALTSADIVDRFTASMVLVPDVETTDEPYVLRATATRV